MLASKLSRSGIVCIIGTLMVFVFSGGLHAQSPYPEKPITLIVPVSPGGSFDITSRLFGAYFPKYLPKPTSVVIVNKPGGAWNIGIREVYKAKPDGYTMGIFHITGNVATQIEGKADYSMEKIVWIGKVSEANPIAVVPTKGKYKTYQELKAAPRIKAAVVGVGSDTDTLICGHKLGLKITQISYNGATEAILSLIRGETDWAQYPYTPLKTSLVDTKELMAVWVYSAKRMEQLPDVPTIKEMGFEDLLDVVVQYRAFGLPPGVPEPIVKIMREAFNKTIADPEFIQKMKDARLWGDPGPADTLPKIVKSAMEQFYKYQEFLK